MTNATYFAFAFGYFDAYFLFTAVDGVFSDQFFVRFLLSGKRQNFEPIELNTVSTNKLSNIDKLSS